MPVKILGSRPLQCFNCASSVGGFPIIDYSFPDTLAPFGPLDATNSLFAFGLSDNSSFLTSSDSFYGECVVADLVLELKDKAGGLVGNGH